MLPAPSSVQPRLRGHQATQVDHVSISPPLDAASVANEAKVRLLVFDHLGPSPPDNLLTRLVFVRGLNKIRPESQWQIGFDGMMIDLPTGADTIQIFTGALGWHPAEVTANR
jgi:hypothetical protein